MLEARFVSDGTSGVLTWDGLGSLWMPIEAGGMDDRLAELARRSREICTVATTAADVARAPANLRQLVCVREAAAAVEDQIERFDNLTHLRIEADIDDGMLTSIGRITSLEDLTLVAPEPTEIAIDALHGCRALRSVRFERLDIDPSTLALFAELRALHLVECRLHGPGMALLATLPVEDLELGVHDLTSRDIELFATMRGVRRWAWTEGRPEMARAGVRAIAEAGSARRLELIVPRAVDLPDLLRGMTSLRLLDVSEIPDSVDRTAALRNALPGVHLILP